ncbi:hypothetical protein [Maribacter antarcticus]|nr:hypothetical protein [Maribacter antarcticus]
MDALVGELNLEFKYQWTAKEEPWIIVIMDASGNPLRMKNLSEPA